MRAGIDTGWVGCGALLGVTGMMPGTGWVGCGALLGVAGIMPGRLANQSPHDGRPGIPARQQMAGARC